MTIHHKIDAKTAGLIDEAIGELPVKLGSLAAKLGVQVFRATLPAGISGEIKKIGEDQYAIRINRHETIERQRFTLAHELGHFLLHRDLIGDGLSDDALYRSKLSNSVEYEANRFAADLLMPRNEVEKLLKMIWGSEDELIQYASKHFGVSAQAAQIRLGI